MTKYEYSIGPTGRCVIVSGGLDGARRAASERLRELIAADAEKGHNVDVTQRRAHVYRNEDGNRRFVGIVRPDGAWIPAAVSA